MMKRICVCAVILATFVIMAPVYVSARIMFVKSDVFTTNYSYDFQLNIMIEMTDDKRTHPPDYVSSIEIVDPNGGVWVIDPILDWIDSGKYYWATLRQADFGGTFPSGVYTINVIDVNGRVTATSDTFNNANNPLPLPTITTPTINEITTATPIIRWTANKQNRKFRIVIDQAIGFSEINQRTFYSPIWTWRDSVWTVNKFLKIPKGVLKPGNTYRLRVEGRYDYIETEKRSRSDWLHFTVAQ